MVTTSYQYPQYLYALQHDGESVQLPNGSWETPAAAWEVIVTREKVDVSQLSNTEFVEAAKATGLVVVTGTCEKFDLGRLHCRLWI